MNKLPINVRGHTDLLFNQNFKFGDQISCIISTLEDGSKQIVDIDKLESNSNEDAYEEDRFITIYHK